MPDLVRVQGLRKRFPIAGLFGRPSGYVSAVEDVEFSIPQGATLGLVGESGCGKTTVGRVLSRLIEADGGLFELGDQEILAKNPRDMHKVKRDIQMVFQDPQASLNPRMTVRGILREPFVVHHLVEKRLIEQEVNQLISWVGLSPEHLNRYPKELSGGQQQRVGICKAISLKPRFLILDEPTSALDVCVQAQILNTLKRIQREMDMTCLFISHDLSVIHQMSDSIAVMYLGQLVEMADNERIMLHTLHPYTRALFSAIPTLPGEERALDITLSGDVPNPTNPPEGCRFHPRCQERASVCSREAPPWRQARPGHWLRCHQTLDDSF